MEKLIENLKELGLNTYESKVYIALLKKNPATGYEISKIANMPQSRTYDTLKVLVDKKIILMANTKPAEYTPIKPKELTKRFKRKFASTIDYLETHLPDLKENYNEPVLSISGEQNIKDKIIEIIRNAEKEIYLEIWSKDFLLIEEELLKAYDRNVEIRIVGYDNLKTNFGMVYEHPFAKNIEGIVDGRMIIMAVDSQEGVIGKIHSQKADSTGILWTHNKDMIFLIKEFIVHDMYLLDIQSNMLEELKYTYGKGFKRLHDKVLGTGNVYNTHFFTK